jgi:hypothetical protein
MDPEEYYESGDEKDPHKGDAVEEDNIDRAEASGGEEGADGEPKPEGDAVAEEDKPPVDEAVAAYEKKLAQANAEDADTDEEYEELPIRTKVHAFREANADKDLLSSELMSEAFRWRLSQTDCQNRGYVLDGYPKSYQQAVEVFVVTPELLESDKPKVPRLDEEGNPMEEEAADEGEGAETAS